MNIKFNDIKSTYMKYIEKYGYVLDSKSECDVYFVNGSQYKFHLYMDKYYSDGYFFDLIDIVESKTYAVWIIFESFFNSQSTSDKQIAEFISDYYYKIVNDESWKKKYDAINSVI